MVIDLPKNIDSFQLSYFEIHGEKNIMSFDLVDPISPDGYFKFVMKNLLFCEYSKDMYENDNCYQLGHFKLCNMDDIGLLESEINIRSIFSLEKIREFYYLDVEGDICLKAIAQECHLIHHST